MRLVNADVALVLIRTRERNIERCCATPYESRNNPSLDNSSASHRTQPPRKVSYFTVDFMSRVGSYKLVYDARQWAQTTPQKKMRVPTFNSMIQVE